MRDINWIAVAVCNKSAAKIWRKKDKRRRMSRGEMQRKLSRITTTTDWSGFQHVDLVVEAVIENLDVKRKVLAEFEAIAKEGAIFASNTSTLLITELASNAKHPDRVVGMHFFNPVDRMPLVEVIHGDHRLGKKGGKGLYFYEGGKRKNPDAAVYKLLGVQAPHPVDKKDAVDRMVLSMINETALILDEKIAASASDIDLAMIMGTGFPPFRGGLLRYADSLGVRNVVARLEELAAKHGPRFKPTEPLRRLAEGGGKFTR